MRDDVEVEVKTRPSGMTTVNVVDVESGSVIIGFSVAPDGYATAGTRGVGYIHDDGAEQRAREWMRRVGEACIEASKVEVVRE